MRWVAAIDQSPELRHWMSLNPRLLLKPGRNYMTRGYGFTARVEAILSHYSLQAKLISTWAVLELAKGAPLRLATLAGKKGGIFHLVLRKTDKFDREGELILSLCDEGGVDIYRYAFAFNVRAGRHQIHIGCMQGPRCIDGRELVKRATKELHGIRPKNLLADAMYALAAAWNIPTLCGVSNQSRVYNGAKTFADYDAFWKELGGSPDQDGMFVLPPGPSHYQLSDLPRQHRPEYKRRMNLRQELGRQLLEATERLKSGDSSSHGASACRTEGQPRES